MVMKKNAINQIAHILQRSTSQPRLKNLPLSPLLTHTQNENLQLKNIPFIPVPAPRVQLLQSSPTKPPRLQPYTSTLLDPDQNPWIKKITKYLKSLQIPKARKTQTAPRQVQHRLSRSMRNFRKKFRTQEAQHLFVNHLFNLPHALHIYNKHEKKETIDNLLLGKDSGTWWKAAGNELGILANGIDN